MKAVYDIEAMLPTTGGFKHGELMLFAAGQQTGKSMLNQMYGTFPTIAQFSITAKAEVDGDTWYTVICSREVSEWLRSQSRELWYEPLAHGFHFTQFDIHEKLYTLLALRWS
jgi:hypothetical protein